MHKYTLKPYIYTVLKGLNFDEEWDIGGWKICQIGVKNIWNRILMFVTLHSESCNFTPKRLSLCTPMDASLHGFLHWSFWKPNLQHFSSSYWMSYILPPRILHSLREYTSFFTRMHLIFGRNVVGFHKECKIFSAGNKYFPGLKILYSRLENIAINVRNKIKAISMTVQF